MSLGFPYVLFGDAEAVCIYILENATELSSYSGLIVSADLKRFKLEHRYIEVVRQGGSQQWPKIDKPRIDFNVYAETRTVAHDIAQVAQAVMFKSMGTGFPSFNVFLSDVRVETGIFRSPEKETGSPRYIFSLRLTCTPFNP